MSEAQMSQINTNRSSVFMRGFIVVQFTQTKILSSYLRTTCTWARAEINSHFAAGPQARWRGASDELYPGRYERQQSRCPPASRVLLDARGRGNVVRRSGALLPAELSAHIVERALIPPIVKPVRASMRMQQLVVAIVAVIALLVPVLSFAVARLIERRRARRTSSSAQW